MKSLQWQHNLVEIRIPKKYSELFVCWYDFKFNILCECFLDVSFWSKKPSFDGIEIQPFRLCKAKDTQENDPKIQTLDTAADSFDVCRLYCKPTEQPIKFRILVQRGAFKINTSTSCFSTCVMYLNFWVIFLCIFCFTKSEGLNLDSIKGWLFGPDRVFLRNPNLNEIMLSLKTLHLSWSSIAQK
jgi:hypothetical protein